MAHSFVRTLVAVLTVASAPYAVAQCDLTEWQTFTSDGQPDDLYGESVALGGNWMMVGAPADDDNGLDAGAVYVYERSGSVWVKTQKLVASDVPSAGDFFGVWIDISGNSAIISAPFDDEKGSDSGAAYIFVEHNGQWCQQAKLLSGWADENDMAGLTVAIDGDTAVVGADQASYDNLVKAGEAYVFVRDGITWDERPRLIAPDAAPGDWFGKVSVRGDTIIVGADHDGDGAKYGSAYVFVWTGIDWEWVQKLNPDDAMAFAEFGNRIAMSGDRVLIGANTDGYGAGSAYVFRRDGANWVQEDKLLASDGGVDDQFGSGIALFGDLAVVGAKQHTAPGSPLQSGQAYVFRRIGLNWVERARLHPSDATLQGHFGFAADISSDAIAVGALMFDLDAPLSGSTYTWGGIPDKCECVADLDGDSSVGITDFLALLAAWGTDPGGPPDFDGDGNVGITDFLALLAAWGPCS